MNYKSILLCSAMTLIGLRSMNPAIANPSLPLGVWADISPAGVPFSATANVRCFSQGMAYDPTNLSIIYLCVCGNDLSTGAPPLTAGIYKTTNGGSSWTRKGHIVSGPHCADTIDEPIHIRVDPKNPFHLYCVDGVRGCSGGFWVSTDGGDNWSMPQGYQDWAQNTGTLDCYDVAVDPTDFNHLLVSFHGDWRASGAGVAESKDGGATWISHPSVGSGGAGMSVWFLYRPDLGIGNDQTWLVGTQNSGYWRTADGGATWSQASTTPIAHGGGQIYYTKDGTIYATSASNVLRSVNNGVSWTATNSPQWQNGIGGDGTYVYTTGSSGSPTMMKSLETDGMTWTNFTPVQQFAQCPFEMVFDTANYILYDASWGAGIWALRVVKPYAGINLSNAHASPASVQDNVSTSVTFSIDATAQGSLTGVTIDLSSIGGSASAAMAKGSGNTYSTTYTIAAGAAPGAHQFVITATDNTNHSLISSIALTVVDHGAPVLVSQNKSVVVSSTQAASVPGSATVDGDMSTRWASGTGDTQWIYVDLGSAMAVNRVVLTWEAAYASGYKIQVSNDATTWTDVYTTTTGNGGTDSITFASTSARYVRMYGTQRGTTYGYSLYEFEIYSPASGSTTVNRMSAAKTVGHTARPALAFSKQMMSRSAGVLYDVKGERIGVGRVSSQAVIVGIR